MMKRNLPPDQKGPRKRKGVEVGKLPERENQKANSTGRIFNSSVKKAFSRILLAGLLLVFWAGLILTLAAPVLADAGPFPTRTPTVTSTLIPTLAIPTPIVLTIIPSLNPLPNQPEATQPLPVLNEPQVEDQQAGLEQEVEDAPAPSSALICWPVAIIVILAIILGGSMVLSRGRGG